ncbi:adenylyl-sulfate kinase [Natronospira bacteriovora]|uniref:Adenylyl-sulfate kinase n=1 Tax=Natronospira bacteriovora TaxID=3069753 RepID=A0ABU0W827_9GAMM|nr:adenylyl-sulfate kinase [Natronospira sp. AB-CW4]MDQ2070146.1 adenylyl-sulfate kinase [Natronospira sp. AB-CW4]
MSGHDGNNAGVIWITGLSDSGKTTVGRLLADRLRSCGNSVVRLDGDELRRIFVGSKGYDRTARLRLAYQYSGLCEVLAEQGHVVVISAIAMFEEIYKWNRSQLPNYFQVYLKTPMSELRRRDTKGIYEGFDRGEEKDVYGLDLKADEPKEPDFLEEFQSDRTPKIVVEDILDSWYYARKKEKGCELVRS